MKQMITFSTFQRLWTEAELVGNQALIAEIFVRGDLEMGDLVPAIPFLGDLEAQSLQYYSTLEADLQCRRLVKPNPKDRVPALQRYAQGVQDALSTMTWMQLRQWAEVMDTQAAFLSNSTTLEMMMANSTDRQRFSELKEIAAKHYERSFASALSRIYQIVGPLKAN